MTKHRRELTNQDDELTTDELEHISGGKPTATRRRIISHTTSRRRQSRAIRCDRLALRSKPEPPLKRVLRKRSGASSFPTMQASWDMKVRYSPRAFADCAPPFVTLLDGAVVASFVWSRAASVHPRARRCAKPGSLANRRACLRRFLCRP